MKKATRFLSLLLHLHLRKSKLVKNLFFSLPSALSSCSILPTSASIVRRTTETISWNFVWAGTMTKPSWRTRAGHSSRATIQWTGKNLLLNARPRRDRKEEGRKRFHTFPSWHVAMTIRSFVSISSRQVPRGSNRYLPRVCLNGVKPLFRCKSNTQNAKEKTSVRRRSS